LLQNQNPGEPLLLLGGAYSGSEISAGNVAYYLAPSAHNDFRTHQVKKGGTHAELRTFLLESAAGNSELYPTPTPIPIQPHESKQVTHKKHGLTLCFKGLAACWKQKLVLRTPISSPSKHPDSVPSLQNWYPGDPLLPLGGAGVVDAGAF
jgi:hypothetical protein